MKVSIIIPVYNVSAYIERCIESVMSQTYKDIECIIVDDATPDDSIVKCEQLIASYQGPIKFSILHHEKNKGIAIVRNTGIIQATGDYIFYLDSDDSISSNCIEKLVEPILSDDSIEMVTGNGDYCSDVYPLPSSLKHIEIIKKYEYTSNAKVRNLFFYQKGYFGWVWNRLIKKSFIEQNKIYFKEGIKWEDALWTFFVIKYLRHAIFIPDITCHYRLRPQSITKGSTHEELLQNYGVIYLEIANNFTKEESDIEAKYYLKKLMSYLFQCPNNPNYLMSAKLFKKALADGHCSKELFLLEATILLSKLRIGKWMYKAKQLLNRK